jgi:hypothetical protein
VGLHTRYLPGFTHPLFYLGLRTHYFLFGFTHPSISVGFYAPVIFHLGLCTHYLPVGTMHPLSSGWVYAPITFLWVYAPIIFLWVYAPAIFKFVYALVISYLGFDTPVIFYESLRTLLFSLWFTYPHFRLGSPTAFVSVYHPLFRFGLTTCYSVFSLRSRCVFTLFYAPSILCGTTHHYPSSGLLNLKSESLGTSFMHPLFRWDYNLQFVWVYTPLN